MPSIVLKLNRRQAIDLHALTFDMSGEAVYKAAHKKVRDEIEKAWPEILPDTAAETAPGEARDLEFGPKEQRAIAEGLLTMANNPNTTGRDYAVIERVAQSCKLWGWVEKHIQQRQVPDFDGVLDGEPELVG